MRAENPWDTGPLTKWQKFAVRHPFLAAVLSGGAAFFWITVVSGLSADWALTGAVVVCVLVFWASMPRWGYLARMRPDEVERARSE